MIEARGHDVYTSHALDKSELLIVSLIEGSTQSKDNKFNVDL
jgi:hypothetical protein